MHKLPTRGRGMISPFILSIELTTPIIPSHYTTLDALLAAALYRQTNSLELAHSQIPLTNTQGLWHGSSYLFYGADQITTPITINSTMQHDLDTHLYAPCGKNGERLTISLRVNERPQDICRQLHHFDTTASEGLLFYGHGDGAACRDLLQNNLFAIGQKISLGYGAIGNIHHTPIEEDHSLHNAKGEPMRPIPKEIWHQLPNTRKRKLRKDYTAWKPPYWEPNHQAECIVPPLFRRFDPP